MADGKQFTDMGDEYARSVRELSPNSQHITDKLPANFMFLGFIRLALPNARVIHCRRDPADTCLSLFKNYFVEGSRYSYDLRELAQYYNAYRRLMAHWHNVMPGFILDVCYEDIISDQVAATQSLLEHCGLEWDDACLEFQGSSRIVKTASAAQVRKSIYKDSVQAWRRYEAQLAPLLEALNDS